MSCVRKPKSSILKVRSQQCSFRIRVRTHSRLKTARWTVNGEVESRKKLELWKKQITKELFKIEDVKNMDEDFN